MELINLIDLNILYGLLLSESSKEEAHVFYILVGGIYIAILLYCYLTAGKDDFPELPPEDDDSEKDNKNKENLIPLFGTKIKKKDKDSENPEKFLSQLSQK